MKFHASLFLFQRSLSALRPKNAAFRIRQHLNSDPKDLEGGGERHVLGVRGFLVLNILGDEFHLFLPGGAIRPKNSRRGGCILTPTWHQKLTPRIHIETTLVSLDCGGKEGGGGAFA